MDLKKLLILCVLCMAFLKARLAWQGSQPGNSGDAHLKTVNLETKAIRNIASIGMGSNLDGLCMDGRGNYLLSDFNGRILRIDPTGKALELLNRTALKRYCADFEYIEQSGLLFIPSLFDNRISAYYLYR